MRAPAIVASAFLGLATFGCGGYGSSTLDRSTTGEPFGDRTNSERRQTDAPAAVFLTANRQEAPMWVRFESVRVLGAKEPVAVSLPEEAAWIDLRTLSDEKGPRPRWFGMSTLPVADVVAVEIALGPIGWLGPVPGDEKKSKAVRVADADEMIIVRLPRRRRESDRSADALLVEIKAASIDGKKLGIAVAEGDARLAKDIKRQAEARVAAKVNAIEPDGQRQLWDLARTTVPSVLAALPTLKEAPAKVGDEVWVRGVYDLGLKRLVASEIAKREVSPAPKSGPSPDTSPAKPAVGGPATPAKP